MRARCAGSFERLVLLAIERVQALAYGMVIRREIEQRTARHISVGAVYVTLRRLEDKGWIRSVGRPRWLSGFTRGRRFYLVEPPGRRAVRLVLRDSDMLRAQLPGLGERQLPPRAFARGLREVGQRYAGPWPEEPSVARRFRTPRDANPRGLRRSPLMPVGWGPFGLEYLPMLADRGPAPWLRKLYGLDPRRRDRPPGGCSGRRV